jgi:hypothetical protein
VPSPIRPPARPRRARRVLAARSGPIVAPTSERRFSLHCGALVEAASEVWCWQAIRAVRRLLSFGSARPRKAGVDGSAWPGRTDRPSPQLQLELKRGEPKRGVYRNGTVRLEAPHELHVLLRHHLLPQPAASRASFRAGNHTTRTILPWRTVQTPAGAVLKLDPARPPTSANAENRDDLVAGLDQLLAIEVHPLWRLPRLRGRRRGLGF